MFKNNKYCNPSQVTGRNINLRPYYLPREINQLCIFIVYIAPSADTEEAGKTILVAEAKSPDAAKFILRDFNLCGLTEQFVSCPTRDGDCLDLCYGIT